MWSWIKKNWKTVALLGIPVLASFIAGLFRSNNSLKKKVELEQNLKEIETDALKLEAEFKETAHKNLSESIAEAETSHSAEIEDISAAVQKKLDEINSAEKATEAIKDSLKNTREKKRLAVKLSDVNLKNGYPDPKRVSRNRMCPCGSGKKYRYCHANYWSKA